MRTLTSLLRCTTTVALCVRMMMSSKASQVFEKQPVVLLDGGTGEELLTNGGVPDDREIWSAVAVVKEEYHENLKRVHQSFLQAGAQAITTNSYGIVPGVGFSDEEIRKYCGIAGRLAREVAVSVNVDVLVLGSLGPLVESYRPDLILEHARGVQVYALMVEALAPYTDAFLAETLSCTEEALQVIDAVKNTQPLLVSFTVDSAGCLRSGETAGAAIPRVLDHCHLHDAKRT